MGQACFPVIAAAAALLAASPAARAAPTETLCSDHPTRLKAHAGVYVTDRLPARVRQTRRWDLGQQGLRSGATELRIDANGRVTVSQSWHEGAALGEDIRHGCLVFDGEQVRLQNDDPAAPALVRIAPPSPTQDADAPYFDLLFTGCFTAAGSGERWCRSGSARL